MQASLHTPETIFSPRHLPSWFLLAAAAGMVNGVGFQICEQYVTHVTGTVTRIGLASPRFGVVGEFTAVLGSFLVGAVASVLVIFRPLPPKQRPRWATPLVIVSLILVGIALAGNAGMFGPLNVGRDVDPPPIVLLSLLAVAMGMQSAAVATTTGLAVRTTHLTGPTTDLGIHLATAMLTRGSRREAALRGALLRGGKAAAFIAGAAVSMPLVLHLGYLSLLAPVLGIIASILLSFIPEWGPNDFPLVAALDAATPAPLPSVASAER